MIKNYAVLIFIALILVSCKQQQDAPLQPSINNESTVAVAVEESEHEAESPEQAATEHKAENPEHEVEELEPAVTEPMHEAEEFSLAKERFKSLLQQQDSEGLLNLLISTDREYYADYLNLDTEDMDTVIRLLAYDINVETVSFELVESAPTRAVYEVNGKKGDIEAALSDLLYIEKVDDSIHYGWSYIRYYPYMEWLAHEYIRLIRLGDPEALASLLIVDDLIYTKENAEKIISAYDTYFDDRSTLQVAFNGNYEFIVMDEKGNNHPFNIVYGDGLMGIHDTLAPEQR